MKTFLLLLALALLAIAPAASAANSAVQSWNETQPNLPQDDQSPVSFSGTWKTIAGGTNQYTVTLKQVGNTVSGTYSPGNGKIFDGEVTDNKLTFKWTQDGGFEGTGEFTMDKDGKGFTGSSTALKPQQFTNTWNSFVSGPAEFGGVWETVSNNAQFAVTLQQVGNTVIGSYTPGNGTIEGTVKDNILRFKWTSDGGKGSGRFVMDEDEMAFRGSYGSGDDPDEADRTWHGTRKMGGGGGKTLATVSFAGTWVGVIKIGGEIITITYRLDQTLERVSGDYVLSTDENTRFTMIGKVSGNTWTFQSSLNGKIVDGQFVMAKDGKSFKGTIGQESLHAISR